MHPTFNLRISISLLSLVATGSLSAQRNEEAAIKGSLIIPTIEQMKNPPSRGAYGPSADIVSTKAHPTIGKAYVILTDQVDKTALAALEKLAKHRKGTIVQTESLGTLHESPEVFEDLQNQLKKLKPRYVAIAPKPESYRENMHLAVLKLLTGLDRDHSLDAFPGYLVAGDSKSLAKLVERSIQYESIDRKTISPASIGAIEDADGRRYRSYQKAKVMQRMFSDEGIESPAIIMTTRKSHLEREDFPKLDKAEGNLTMEANSERHTFDRLSSEIKTALKKNNMLFMFGHGTPSRICGSKISAYQDIDFENEIVFCGSCNSAIPYKADRIDLGARKGGKRFAFVAIDNGAVMMLGHMGLCGGFPKIYPMGENVLKGLSSGESYQRLMNALIRNQPIPDYYPSPAPKGQKRPGPANNLLYILLGDPALVPVKS